jgi:hypothetical protein
VKDDDVFDDDFDGFICARCQRRQPDGFIFDRLLWEQSNGVDGMPDGWRVVVQAEEDESSESNLLPPMLPTCPGCITREDDYLVSGAEWAERNRLGH